MTQAPTAHVLRGSFRFSRRGAFGGDVSPEYPENDARDEFGGDSQSAALNDSRNNVLDAASNGSSNATTEDVSNYTLADDEVD